MIYRQPKALNTIAPKPGMTLQIYMSRKDVGSGVRAYVIIGLSSRYVTLFYPPKLKVVKVKRKEWPTLAMNEFLPNLRKSIDNIKAACLERQGWGARIPGKAVAKCIKLLEERLAKLSPPQEAA